SPRRPQYERNTDIASSRSVISATGSHQKPPAATTAHIAPSTSALSASGSRKAPERVVPMRRASQPSSPPVAARSTHSASTPYEGPEAMMTPHSGGAPRSRPTVTALAGVASADGPNEVAMSDRHGLEVGPR